MGRKKIVDREITDRFGDYEINDKRFDPIMREILIRQITEVGATAVAAAREAGISARLFREWMEKCESFKLFIQELEHVFKSRLRKKITNAIDMLELENRDFAQVADKAMKFLERIDPDDFGRKSSTVKVEGDAGSAPLINPVTDTEVQEVIKQAEKASNAVPPS